jgi:hypothetical protein
VDVFDEQCDKTLGKSDAQLPFSGLYAGIVETGQTRADVQLQLVRRANTVQGSYFRDGLCGKVFGDVANDKLAVELGRISWTRPRHAARQKVGGDDRLRRRHGGRRQLRALSAGLA